MKDLIEQALAMIQDRPRDEIELMHATLTMDDELKVAFLVAYQISKESPEWQKDYLDYVARKDQAE